MTKMYRELSREDKIELFTQYVDGAVIEYKVRPSDDWIKVPTPSWQPTRFYRVRQEPLSINWDHVDPVFVALAKDADGRSFLFTKVPEESTNGQWVIRNGHDEGIIKASVFSSFVDSDINWKDSLVERPTPF